MVDLFQPYHTWEKFSSPSKQCSGLVNPLTETQSLALAAGQTLGCLGIPFFSLKHDWTNPIGFISGLNEVWAFCHWHFLSDVCCLLLSCCMLSCFPEERQLWRQKKVTQLLLTTGKCLSENVCNVTQIHTLHRPLILINLPFNMWYILFRLNGF